MVEVELFALQLEGPMAPAAEIEEALWVDGETASNLPLAPLTRSRFTVGG